MTRLAAVIRVVLMAALSPLFAKVLVGVLVVGDERSQGRKRPGRDSSHTTRSDRESPATSRRRPAPQGLEMTSATHI